ncbi:N-alpha-acetyltransferase, non-catalitic subunit [Friedmanniomyces endolithicus]|nr:N-alpha-acetyltransferase, non-catalitic subunit [Friedmanniomyces endolithicus]KAK0798178.1 N-alpha-acetyltransferase, non-catalitic subunit [Friedmanniomyces endolithicus]KAK0805409.1 N-alpha-acetyltransferase, non-catalitic subunit [Friedmanniomyces endolithicus]
MPEDDLADEASHLTIDGDNPNGDDIGFAAKRLAHEARKTLSSGGGSRGIRDVTQEFAAAAKLLQPGQLVKDEYFTLFEAVGALEIMDPKMDSGYVPPGDTLEPDFDVCKGLPAEQVLWIMDELLRLTAVWHDGYPLSQTIFTSLHVDRLLSPDNRPPYHLFYGDTALLVMTTEQRLVHIVLRAYCIALVKSCALVLHTIQSQNFYEEEDFVTHLFGRELLPSTGANDAVKLIDEAVKFLDGADVDKVMRTALLERLQFARTYISLLVSDSADWNTLAAMGRSAETHKLAQPILEAFSDKVQRQLATSTPPRPMIIISWDEALERWKAICADIVEADRLTCFDVCQSPHALHRAIWAFAYREPQPNTFARAYLQTILFASEQITEGMAFFDLMLTDMRDLVLAGDVLVDPHSFLVEIPSDPRHKCSRIVETFMDKAFDEYMNLYRMVCQNRCRIRRTFTQSVAIFDSLETEAMRTDAELDGITPGIVLAGEDGPGNVTLTPLTSWVKYYKLQTMAWTIQLGFETDIYLPHELSMMYWYLMVFARRERKLLEHIERFLAARQKTFVSSRDARQDDEAAASQEWLAVLHKQADFTALLSSALWQVSELLITLCILQPAKRDYAQEQLLYDVRMKSYLGIAHDPIPTLEEYKSATQSDRSIEDTCNNINGTIADAKSCLAYMKKTTPEQGKYIGTGEQWKREIKQLETTCVAVAVQTSQLRRVADKHGKLLGAPRDQSLKGAVEVSIPPAGSRYHDWWVVPQIREKKT